MMPLSFGLGVFQDEDKLMLMLPSLVWVIFVMAHSLLLMMPALVWGVDQLRVFEDVNRLMLMILALFCGCSQRWSYGCY